MSKVLQIGDRTVTSSEFFPLMMHYQMMPTLLREQLIDHAVEPITCTADEIAQARQAFCCQHQLTSDDACQAWMVQHGLDDDQFIAVVTRSLKIEKFKQHMWGHQLQSYFLRRKNQLDQVIYSVLRTKAIGVAQELYYRIQEGEQSFADAAREYSQGPEAQTGGLTGPVELSRPPRLLTQMLTASQPGQLWRPLRLGEWYIVLRLEQYLPARLDEAMRERLLTELFEAWLKEQLSKQRVNVLQEAA